MAIGSVTIAGLEATSEIVGLEEFR